MRKLWGGRFAKQTDALVHQFNASISFDARLYAQDISGSLAWARGLEKIDVLTAAETASIIAGLEQVRNEFADDTFVFESSDEDIHTAVERRLIEIVGPVGGKLHTGRSRNDQIATDFRLWVMDACKEMQTYIGELQNALIASAEQQLNLPMPGYTHLQHAQPITWGHWILSHFWPLTRDVERFGQVYKRTAVLPLGSAAFAGSAYPLDRATLAADLGFLQVSENSLDGVSDRDFVADFLYAAAMVGLHLSRLSEQLVLFSSSEFGFVRLDDAYSTGSSIMPQKKNPDTLELTRGKSGRLIGNLTGLLVTLKGLPSSYDKDLQEDKEPVFDAFDTLAVALPVMAGLIATLLVQPAALSRQLEPGLLATELADYLAKKGVPFREAHSLVGQAVRLAEVKAIPFDTLTADDLQGISPHFGIDAADVLQVSVALSQRNIHGGTGPKALAIQLENAKKWQSSKEPAI